MAESKRMHIYISGIVQGVFFRANTQEIAKSLGLIGWVRNLPDGRVEIIAEGIKERLENLISWCQKGPPGARVDDVDAKWEDATGEFENFDVKCR
jgi:acylphosphatase